MNFNGLGLVAHIDGDSRIGVRRSDAIVAADVALECAADEPTFAAGLIASPFEQYRLIGPRVLSIVNNKEAS